MIRTFLAKDEQETAAAGQAIAALTGPEELIYLHGDLGAGKTTLIRAVAAALGADPLEVASPTFAIVHEYPTERGDVIVHLDCYRISDDLREWEEIGIPDILQQPGVKFVEWPKERFDLYATPTAEIALTVREDHGREIVFRRGE